MIQNFTNIFHVAIITISLLVFTGCGYKADPTYQDEKQTKMESK